MIPYLSNFAAIALVALVLAALPVFILFRATAKIVRRKTLAVTAAVALFAALGLFVGADAYVGRMWPVAYGGQHWSLEKSYRSIFGTVKILKSETLENGKFQRIYFQDGLIQNTVDSDQHSTSMYTYALEALSFMYKPELGRALVLGIGAGMVPMRLARQGVGITAVDIDPASLQAATEVFGLDPVKVSTHITDARTFLRGCGGDYPMVILDLFHGDGVPDYLVTRDFFSDLRRCLASDGIAVFNTFADLEAPRAYAHFLATLRSELPYIVLYRPDYGALNTHINSFIVASGKPLPSPGGAVLRDVPPRHFDVLQTMLRDPLPLDKELLEHGRVITDSRNTVSKDIAISQLINRRQVVESLPAAFLVN
jgi:spermidine synthase